MSSEKDIKLKFIPAQFSNQIIPESRTIENSAIDVTKEVPFTLNYIWSAEKISKIELQKYVAGGCLINSDPGYESSCI